MPESVAALVLSGAGGVQLAPASHEVGDRRDWGVGFLGRRFRDLVERLQQLLGSRSVVGIRRHQLRDDLPEGLGRIDRDLGARSLDLLEQRLGEAAKESAARRQEAE